MVLAADEVFRIRVANAPFRHVSVLPLASLRSRLFVVVAAAITPFVLYAALTAARGKSVAGDSFRNGTLARARATARSLDERLLLVDQMLDSAMVQVRQPAAGMHTLVLPDSAQNPLAGALSIAVLDRSGQRTGLVMGSGSRVDAIPLERRTLLVASALGSARQTKSATPATFVDEGGARSETDSIAMIIVRPIPRSGPRCNCLADTPGTLVAALSDKTVQRLLGSDTLPDGGVLVLTGSTGALLGRPLTPERWTVRDTLLVTAGAQREGMLDLEGQDQIARSVGFSALKRLPWRVYVGVPLSSMTAVAGLQLRDALMLSVLALGIAAIGVVIASRAFSGPLQTLVADTKRLAAGALSHRTEVAETHGELGTLGIAMNTLAAGLESRRKAMQEELRRVTMIFETSPVPMWVSDAADEGPGAGRIQHANLAAAQLFDVADGSLIGQRDSELVDATAAYLLAPAAAETDQTSPAVRTGFATIRSSSGRVRECQLHVVITNSNPPLRIVTAQDAASAVEKLRMPAVAAPDLPVRSLSSLAPAPAVAPAQPEGHVVAFAGKIADNFTDVLQGMMGFTQLALESTDDPDMRTIAVERIRDLSLRGLMMARQVQAFGQRDVLQLHVIDANEILTESVQAMAETLGRDVELDVLYNVSPAAVHADADLLAQVVSALISNARDAMPAGGTLTLATTLVEVPANTTEQYDAPAGRYIVLTVADTGMGMSPESQRNMFEPFWSTKRTQGSGTGLGLAAVSGIAQQHGWVISVDSESAVGTAISLYMPVADESLIEMVGIDDQIEIPAGNPAHDSADDQVHDNSDDQSSLETMPARSA